MSKIKLHWIIETIPDAALLFRRFHKQWMDEDGLIDPGLFKDIEMSADWNKYSTATQSRARAKKAEDNGIVELNVGSLKLLPQDVIHIPSLGSNNRSHSNIKGIKDEEMRLKIRAICKKVIIPSDPI